MTTYTIIINQVLFCLSIQKKKKKDYESHLDKSRKLAGTYMYISPHTTV